MTSSWLELALDCVDFMGLFIMIDCWWLWLVCFTFCDCPEILWWHSLLKCPFSLKKNILALDTDKLSIYDPLLGIYNIGSGRPNNNWGVSLFTMYTKRVHNIFLVNDPPKRLTLECICPPIIPLPVCWWEHTDTPFSS